MQIKLNKLSVSSYITFIMFVSDKHNDLSLLALERGITRRTAINHILPYIIAGVESRSLQKMTPPEYSLVKSYLEGNPDSLSIKAIHSYFKGKVSYDSIWLSVAFFLRQDETYPIEDILEQFSELKNALRNKRIYLNADTVYFRQVDCISFYNSGSYKVSMINSLMCSADRKNKWISDKQIQKQGEDYHADPSFRITEYTLKQQRAEMTHSYYDDSDYDLAYACDDFFDAMSEVDDRG